MLRIRIYSIVLIAALVAFAGQVAFADTINNAVIAVSGYDVVSYHSEDGPTRGSGYLTAEHDGVTYLFATKKNKRAFERNPAKYVPAYGGYCAYGAALGKKFYTDPEVYKLVNGKLYLNLDKGIQKKWSKDISGYIEKADAKWQKIHDKAPSEL